MKCLRVYSLMVLVLLMQVGIAQVGSDQLEAYLSYPNPASLTSSGSKLAWTFNEQGKRNIFVADGPDYQQYRQLTAYNEDTGQEITSLSISADGKWVVYERGAEHGGNWSTTTAANPESLYDVPGVEIWIIPFSRGTPRLLAAGSFPRISPKSDEVAYLRSGTVWTVPIDGSAKPARLFSVRGNARHIAWSPSGDQMAFSASRTSHSFIGVWDRHATAVQWIGPAFSHDIHPTWSPDGRSIAFIRLPGSTDENGPILERTHQPWEIQVADVATGESRRLWKAPETLAGSIPTTHGRYNLNWVAGDRIVFLSYHDGWPHLYSMPSAGGQELLLTPGDFMVEELQVSPDRTRLLFSANTGPEPQKDIDRRHIGTVSVDKADMQIVTPGDGAETTPVFLGASHAYAFLSSTPTRPPMPAVLKSKTAKLELLAVDRIPPTFPLNAFVTPEQVIFTAPDGTRVHGQLFEKKDGKTNKPAIVFVHGGPQRQMMLSWDHRGYYAHTYAMNQYLANEGYVVLSVNFRLGIGYGYEFHKPEAAGRHGASEYQDVKAGGEWLASQPHVDASRIGIWGGSYGGYLTALALGKDSDLFAAGVDIHGVHTRVPSAPYASIYEQAPDAAEADRIAWESSPIAYADTWKSPVLFIHSDDDRNVGFAHSVDLAQRLEKRGVEYEVLAIPDDNHHWFLHRNLLKTSRATIDFFNRKLNNR